eukprot:NODE_136_length_16465_cov_1.184957.p6 type:complete len:330 gc:universal NODE_136_length_16465_cov_1.184957:9009-8020(-)
MEPKTTKLNSLNLMIVGRKGSGKTAFAHTLYKYFGADPNVKEEGHLTIYTGPIEYNKDKTNLTLVDSNGFSFNPNDKVDLEIMTDILKFIEKQYELQLMEELKVKRLRRAAQKNTMVDCILYVLSPMQDMLGGDIEVMKRLCMVANVIPVLSHADSMSCKLRETWKNLVRETMKSQEIPIFPFIDPEEGEMFDEDKAMAALVPFLICDTDEEEGLLGKSFPWGNLEIKNPEHTNLVHLVHCLLVTSYFALKNTTQLQFYEKYRTHKLLSRQQAIEQTLGTPGNAEESAAQINRKSINDLPGLDRKIDPDRVYSIHSFYGNLEQLSAIQK